MILFSTFYIILELLLLILFLVYLLIKFILSSIFILHLKEWLTVVLDHELCDDCARLKNRTVPHVVAEDLGENPQVLELPVDCLMTSHYPSIHLLLVLGWVTSVVGALYFVGVPGVSCLNLFARL